MANKYQDLVKLEGYENWFIVPVTNQLVYRKTIGGKYRTIRTGITAKINTKTGRVDGIKAAREYVEIETEKILTGKSAVVIKREMNGETNPLIGEIWRDELFPIKTAGKSPNTVKNYEKAWTHGLEKFWGKKSISEMTTENIGQYKIWYLKSKPDRLFDKTFDFLKMLITFMVERNYLTEKPSVRDLNDLDEIIKKNKRYKKAGRVYTDAECERLLSAWQSIMNVSHGGTTSSHRTILAARSRLTTILGLRCGLRKMEAGCLEWSRVDLKKRSIEVWSTKNSQWRDVPIDHDVVEAFKFHIEALGQAKSKWVFPMPSNPKEHVSDGVMEKIWYKTRDHAQIRVSGPQDARFHDLRKTFTTFTAEQGWPIRTACAILDMTIQMYENTYANNIRLHSKSALMDRAFQNRKDGQIDDKYKGDL